MKSQSRCDAELSRNPACAFAAFQGFFGSPASVYSTARDLLFNPSWQAAPSSHHHERVSLVANSSHSARPVARHVNEDTLAKGTSKRSDTRLLDWNRGNHATYPTASQPLRHYDDGQRCFPFGDVKGVQSVVLTSSVINDCPRRLGQKTGGQAGLRFFKREGR
jgi:hypothetical protein